MNAHLLVDSVVQQTMVFIAELSTAGGVRAPLAHVADQVFADLIRELTERGVKQKVIADMFGMALRTYHRRVHQIGESRTDVGKSVWEAVLEHVRAREPVSGRDVLLRFSGDDPEVVQGVLADLAQSGLVYRAGRGDTARYRVADEADFPDDGSRDAASEHLVWLAAYRKRGAARTEIVAATRLAERVVERSLAALVAGGRVAETKSGASVTYAADRFEIPLGAPNGWEAAVLDHFQAMVTAIIAKLRGGRTDASDQIGGSTWSLDVWPGHPFEGEAKSLLREIRARVEGLRVRIDAHNSREKAPPREQVVFYAGQNVRELSLASEES